MLQNQYSSTLMLHNARHRYEDRDELPLETGAQVFCDQRYLVPEGVANGGELAEFPRQDILNDEAGEWLNSHQNSTSISIDSNVCQ